MRVYDNEGTYIGDFVPKGEGDWDDGDWGGSSSGRRHGDHERPPESGGDGCWSSCTNCLGCLVLVILAAFVVSCVFL